MHKRKVQKTGGSTYFVTLPKAWAESVGIKPGVEVTMMPNDAGTLLLVPESISRENRCAIELGNWDFDRFQREVISRYIVGYDIIEIRNAKENGAIAIGVASDEVRGQGWNDQKVERLKKAGCDVLIPDFSKGDDLMDYLFQNEADHES